MRFQYGGEVIDELNHLLGKEMSTQYQISPSLPWNLKGKGNCGLWRHKICDWYYGFIDHFNFDREVVGVAINYFDRYTSITVSSLDDDDEHTLSAYCRIVAVTALFIAIKLHATSCEKVDDLLELRNRALRRILDDTTNPQVVFDMEMIMLKALEWCVNPPTLHQFAFILCDFHPLNEICAKSGSYIYEATRFQAELAIFMPDLLANFKPSIIVYAAVKNAEEKIAAANPDILTDDVKQTYEVIASKSGVIMDSAAVARCQILLKGLCPRLPDLDCLNDTKVVTPTTSIDMQMGRSISNSPKMVGAVDFDHL